MRILVFGANGKLGRQLVSALSTEHQVTGATSAEADIAKWDDTHNLVERVQPELVINTAAWTDVDGCALDPAKALLINGIGAHNIALAAHRADAAILQVSTNEVFDGSSARPYQEYDIQKPANPYGYSKFHAECAIIQTTPRHYIVRTSWLFAHGGRNFLHTILQAARAGKALRVVVDEVANPTYNDDLVTAISQLITTERYGIYHLANEGATSRYELARTCLDVAGLQDVTIAPITRYDWVRPSRPPRYASLANHTAHSLGIRLRPWREAVADFVHRDQLITTNQPT